MVNELNRGALVLLASVLKEMGIEGPLKPGKGIRRVQWTIALMKYAGADLGYSFQWYDSGPFSDELLADAFMVLNGPHAVEALPVSARLRQELALIKDCIPKHPCSKALDSLWLQALACCGFVAVEWRLSQESTVKNVRKTHPHLDLEMLEDACSEYFALVGLVKERGR